MRLLKVELLDLQSIYKGNQLLLRSTNNSTSYTNFEVTNASHLNVSVKSYVNQGESMEHGYETSDVASC